MSKSTSSFRPEVRSLVEAPLADSPAPVALHSTSAHHPHIRDQSPGRFSALQARARRLLGNRVLQQAPAHLLKRLAQRALAALRELHAELRESAVNHESARETPVSLMLVRQVDELLDTIEAHLTALDEMSAVLGRLSNLARALLERKPMVWSQLLPELRIPAGCDRDMSSVINLWPGFATGGLVATRTDCAGSVGLLRGLQTAQVVNQTLRANAIWEDRLPLLTAAALLQDVGTVHISGLLAIESRNAAQLKARLALLHPLISAAALGTIAGAPANLASIVAQHHERCDGGGFPRRLGSIRLSRGARLLAAANRFVELGEDGAATEEFASSEEQAIDALDRLRSEAAAGWWDPEFVQLIDSRWRPQATKTHAAGEPSRHATVAVASRLQDAAQAAGATSAFRVDDRESAVAERHTAPSSTARRAMAHHPPR